ncbi:MAG: hypothetical protein HYU64_04650, partial [Armatimonadetes bacterium]|nr:hypothetical protein [Armatimonadota bacterium]
MDFAKITAAGRYILDVVAGKNEITPHSNIENELTTDIFTSSIGGLQRATEKAYENNILSLDEYEKLQTEIIVNSRIPLEEKVEAVRRVCISSEEKKKLQIGIILTSECPAETKLRSAESLHHQETISSKEYAKLKSDIVENSWERRTKLLAAMEEREESTLGEYKDKPWARSAYTARTLSLVLDENYLWGDARNAVKEMSNPGKADFDALLAATDKAYESGVISRGEHKNLQKGLIMNSRVSLEEKIAAAQHLYERGTLEKSEYGPLRIGIIENSTSTTSEMLLAFDIYL